MSDLVISAVLTLMGIAYACAAFKAHKDIETIVAPIDVTPLMRHYGGQASWAATFFAVAFMTGMEWWTGDRWWAFFPAWIGARVLVGLAIGVVPIRKES